MEQYHIHRREDGFVSEMITQNKEINDVRSMEERNDNIITDLCILWKLVGNHWKRIGFQ